MGIKSFELEPSRDNLLITLTKNLLDRNDIVLQFAQFCDAQDNKCSVAIDGKWGSGKTFFVRHVQMLIDSYNPKSSLTDEERNKIKSIFSETKNKGNKPLELKQEICVYYDAWSNDNDEDPILSLVYEITKKTTQNYPFEKGTDCLKTVSLIFSLFTGKNVADLVDLMREKDPLSKLKSKKEIDELVTDFLDSLLYEQGDRLIVFIDELDRCKPEYAVRLLERIKHYFSNDRTTFVFSVNISELQHTVKRYYGEGFDACRYLNRFFDYIIPLPHANLTRYTGYYSEIGLDSPLYPYEYVCRLVVDYCHLEVREIGKFYRMAKVAAYLPTHNNSLMETYTGNGIYFSLSCIVPIMIGLRMTDMSLYNEFIEGNNSQPLLDILGDRDQAKYNFCSVLLERSEKYEGDTRDKTKKSVSFSDKLNEAYIALFSKKEESLFDETTIGDCKFTYYTRETVLKTASMLSEYAMYYELTAEKT